MLGQASSALQLLILLKTLQKKELLELLVSLLVLEMQDLNQLFLV